MAGERLTLPSGQAVIGFTSSEVDSMGDNIDAMEASVRGTTGPCHDALLEELQPVLQIWDELQANTIYARYNAQLRVNFPEDLVGGSWLSTTDTQDLHDGFWSFIQTQRECELTDDPNPWVSDPDEPADAEPPPEDAGEPLSIPQLQGGGSGSGGPSMLLVGLGLAFGVVGAVWLLFKGRR